MTIEILGSGTVAQTLGAGLIKLEHNVKLGTRNPGKLDEWFDSVGGRGRVGSFEEEAAFGEMVFNSTARGTEMLLPLWMRLFGVRGTPMFNFEITR